MKRRTLLGALSAGLVPRPVRAQNAVVKGSLPLTEFEPRSMLHVHETQIERAKFPVIDFHTHISWGDNMAGKESVSFPAPASELWL